MPGREEWLGHFFALVVPAAIKGPQGEQSNFGLLSPMQEWQSQFSPGFRMQNIYSWIPSPLCQVLHTHSCRGGYFRQQIFHSFDAFCMQQKDSHIRIIHISTGQWASTITSVTHSGYSLQCDYLVQTNSELRMLKTDKNFFSVEARRFGSMCNFSCWHRELTGAQNFTTCTAFTKRDQGKLQGLIFCYLQYRE